MIIRARFVLPMGQPPIDDGAVVVEGDKITAVGKTSEIRAAHTGEVRDLGERVHHRRSRARVGFRRNRPADHHDRRGATLRSARGEEGS